MKPALQLALDFVDLHRALGVAREAVRGGVDWLEVGTPLLNQYTQKKKTKKPIAPIN